jgi:hypothetical protein
VNTISISRDQSIIVRDFFARATDAMGVEIAKVAVKVADYMDPAQHEGYAVPVSVEMSFGSPEMNARVDEYLDERANGPRAARPAPEPKPEVGMPASYCILGDAYPVVITAVSKSGHQVEYAFEYDGKPGEKREKATRRADGRYRPVGSGSGSRLLIGKAISKRDPHV